MELTPKSDDCGVPFARQGSHRFGRTEHLVYGRPFEDVILEQCEAWGVKSVFVLTTRSLSSSLAQRLQAALGGRFAGMHDTISAHTPMKTVLEAAEAARRAQAHLIVALGGGSVIDGAKAVLLSLWSGADTVDRMTALSAPRQAGWSPPAEPVRMIAVPTTLSGAEFTDMAGVSDERGRKRRFMHPLMAPRSVILDPAAAMQTPAELWLSTGMRAVDHAIETVCAPQCSMLSEVAALRALELLCRGLQRVAGEPLNLDARLECQIGMWMACIGPAAGVPMGVSHGIGHILGSEFGLPHGVTSCVMMCAAMTWNRPAVLERQQLMERHIPSEGETAAAKIARLLEELKLPRRLSDVGIGADAFENIAERSMTDFFIPTNPRPVRSAEDILEILRLAA